MKDIPKLNKGVKRLMWTISIAAAGAGYPLGGNLFPGIDWARMRPKFSHVSGAISAVVAFLAVWILFYSVRWIGKWIIAGFRETRAEKGDR
jgi:hypothetical protein